MKIPKIASSEITPRHIYLSRRKFMTGLGAVAGTLALNACAPGSSTPAATTAPTSSDGEVVNNGEPMALATTDELGNELTSYDGITSYNNFYEFSTNKQSVALMVDDFRSSPWTVEVGGMVNNPGFYDVDDIKKMFDQEERVFRLRCVEGWSMVIPWVGFSLRKLIEMADPTAEAKYVRFETAFDPDQFPAHSNRSSYDWPYVEGLRLDEAMNDLATLATGLYGQDLPAQNGAPLRLVVPWKYGFKSIKSIAKIELVDYMPTSLWMDAAGHEYGFFANVNPEVDHPRWSQSSERRIGQLGRQPTLMFNGYEEQVSYLYEGMDLAEWY